MNTKVCVVIPKELKDKAQNKAKEQCMSLNTLIRLAILSYLENNK